MSRLAKDVNRCLIAMQNGDLHKFEDLYKLTYNHMKSVALLYLTNKSLCEDVVEDIYVKFFKYYYSYQIGADGYNWMCKAAEHIAFNYNKIEKEKNGNVNLDDIAPPADPINAYENSDMRISLDAIFETLGEPNRTIAIHRYYLGETMEQIGRIVGMGKVAVYKRLQKINAIVKEKYFES